MLLVLSLGLILADAIVTRRGMIMGFREVNPILRHILGKFGLTGFAITRVGALVLLLILFWILDPWEWITLSSAFSAVMGYVVLAGVRKLMAPRTEHVTLTPIPSTNRD